jgi:hypothetical protein
MVLAHRLDEADRLNERALALDPSLAHAMDPSRMDVSLLRR